VVGVPVGALVVGAPVGALVVGVPVGAAVGAAVGLVVGAAVGLVVGAEVGLVVGGEVGLVVGAAVGLVVGAVVGVPVGAAVVGAAVGVPVGALVVGAPVGALVVGAAVVGAAVVGVTKMQVASSVAGSVIFAVDTRPASTFTLYLFTFTQFWETVAPVVPSCWHSMQPFLHDSAPRARSCVLLCAVAMAAGPTSAGQSEHDVAPLAECLQPVHSQPVVEFVQLLTSAMPHSPPALQFTHDTYFYAPAVTSFL